ncbi:hypothetical protein [Phaeobacter sp. HF9A]|uniref:hypothetical protein n=1 Tax=Phaeobacter sp. HF9A TaxID=2721561 RepID=UPI0014308FD8|nr:hypothetical protein [Phaeobacter sp. HF9A]NIZ12029.1 hypothetical protein [Phaeobacter sp. HF9A]
MLNAMVDKVLDPGALTDFEDLIIPDVTSCLLPEDKPQDLASARAVRFESGPVQLELVELLAFLRPLLSPDRMSEPNYFTGCELAASDKNAQAAIAFLSAAVHTEHQVPSLYGLATQMHALGENGMAQGVAIFLTRIWPEDPRSLALLGTIEGALGNMKAARKHLSTVAHMSRRNPKYSNVLRYSQKKLIQQQFSDRTARPLADALRGN